MYDQCIYKKTGETKYISFFKKIFFELLKKYDEIWDKISYNIKKDFDSEPVYNVIDIKN